MSQYRLQSQVNLPDNPKFNKSYKSDLWQEIEKIQHKIKLKKPSIKIRIIRKNKNQARERERERERVLTIFVWKKYRLNGIDDIKFI